MVAPLDERAKRLTLTEKEARLALDEDDLWIGDVLIWRHKRKKPEAGKRVLRIRQMWRSTNKKDWRIQVVDSDGNIFSLPLMGHEGIKTNYRKKRVKK